MLLNITSIDFGIAEIWSTGMPGNPDLRSKEKAASRMDKEAKQMEIS